MLVLRPVTLQFFCLNLKVLLAHVPKELDSDSQFKFLLQVSPHANSVRESFPSRHSLFNQDATSVIINFLHIFLLVSSELHVKLTCLVDRVEKTSLLCLSTVLCRLI